MGSVQVWHSPSAALSDRVRTTAGTWQSNFCCEAELRQPRQAQPAWLAPAEIKRQGKPPAFTARDGRQRSRTETSAACSRDLEGESMTKHYDLLRIEKVELTSERHKGISPR